MRRVDLVAVWALLAHLVPFTSVQIVHVHQGRVPLVVGLWLAVLLLVGAVLCLLIGRPEGRPAHDLPDAFSRGFGLFSLFFALAGLPFTLALVLYRGEWALVPPIVVGGVLCALALAAMYRERWRPAPMAPEPTPKLVGLPPGARLPHGWVPVHVHRDAGRNHDALVEYRVDVDGSRVGALGRGQALMIGLAAGSHVVQGWAGGLSSPPVRLVLVEGEVAHLVLGSGGTVLDLLFGGLGRGHRLQLRHHDGGGADVVRVRQ